MTRRPANCSLGWILVVDDHVRREWWEPGTTCGLLDRGDMRMFRGQNWLQRRATHGYHEMSHAGAKFRNASAPETVEHQPLSSVESHHLQTNQRQVKR